MAEQTVASIDIAAPARAVMAVIEDLVAYPSWNDEIRSVDVLDRFADGRPSSARLVVDSSAFKDDYTLAYRWDGDRAAHWSLVGEAHSLSRLDGSYELAALSDRRTRVSYTLAVDVKIPMIGMLKRKAEKVLIERALRGLRSRVEAHDEH